MRKLFLVLFSFAALTGFAQKNFKPGYIVTNSGDTVKGQIDYFEWEINPVSILFKNAVDQRSYGVWDIRAFGLVDGDEYIKAIVTYHQATLDIIKAQTDYVETIKTDTVFLRTLVKGRYMLYVLGTRQRPYFFVSENNNAPVELVAKFIKHDDLTVTPDNAYRDFLFAAAARQGKAAELKNRISNMSYSESGITKVVLLINGDNSSVAGKKEEKVNAFEIGIGAAYSTFSISGGSNGIAATNILNAASMKGSISPDLEAAIVLGSQRGLNRVKARLSLGYSSLKFEGDGNPAVAPSASVAKESYSGKVNFLKPGVGVIFVMNPYDKSKFYINPGINLWLVLGDATITRSTSSIYGGTIEYKDYPVLTKAALAMGLGFGVQMDKSRIELKGDYSANFSEKPESKIHALRVVLGYHYTLSKF